MTDRHRVERDLNFSRCGRGEMDILNDKRRAVFVTYGSFDGFHAIFPPILPHLGAKAAVEKREYLIVTQCPGRGSG